MGRGGRDVGREEDDAARLEQAVEVVSGGEVVAEGAFQLVAEANELIAKANAAEQEIMDIVESKL